MASQPSPKAAPTPSRSRESGNDGLAKKLRSWLRANLRGKPHDHSLKEALEEVLEEHEEEGLLASPSEEQNMLKNVITFADSTVHDIMTPRTEIKGVEYNITLPELKAHISQHIHTRIPVYNDSLDNIKGFVHVKDLVPHLSNDTPFNMALILRELLFVPPSMPLINLLVRMRKTGVHMAIVVDEYGGTDGLVTLEDLFEEIVGDIQDEHDEEDPYSALSWSAAHTCDMDASTPIEKLDERLGLNLLPDATQHEYDTVGGLIFFTLDRVPVKGEICNINEHLRCEILTADPRRIHRIRLTLLEPVAKKE